MAVGISLDIPDDLVSAQDQRPLINYAGRLLAAQPCVPQWESAYKATNHLPKAGKVCKLDVALDHNAKECRISISQISIGAALLVAQFQ